MSEGERARVGQALDTIRAALSAYVDEAMVRAYGDQWDDVVAEEDARRSKNGRKWPVSKTDLAVMLKALIHRRIQPWSSLREYQRMRAFATEILTLRNLHAHGDECDGEYGRLIDTGGRMLTLLGIPVPEGLRPPSIDLVKAAGGDGSVQLPAQQTLAPISRWDAEFAHLGEVGEQVQTVFVRAMELDQMTHSAVADESAALDPDAPDFESFTQRLATTFTPIGAEAIELLAELERLELAGTEPKDPVLALMFLITRRQLTTGLKAATDTYRLDLIQQGATLLDVMRQRQIEVIQLASESENPTEALESLPHDDDLLDHPGVRELFDRVSEIDRLLSAMGSENYSQEIQQVASQLGEASPLANLMLAWESIDAAQSSRDEDGHWTREALPHLREAISRLRFEAGMEPGTGNESILVRALRLEGEVYNDIGQPEDALKSFARAAEIVDRYPSADPNLQA